jgi:hypothetical protein
LTGVNLAAASYRTAAEPNSIVFIPSGHFAAYTGDGFELASGAARDWFTTHLY